MTIITQTHIFSNSPHEVAAWVYNQAFKTPPPKKRKEVVMLEKRTDEEVQKIAEDYKGTNVDIDA